MNINYQRIIDSFYPEGELRREILLAHSRSVAEKAVDICRRYPELGADDEFVRAAAMLHDIGICKCYAPSIGCTGVWPYICHGQQGGRMLLDHWLKWGYEPDVLRPYARVCERHTGTGLTPEQIRRDHLPLPALDFTPQTLEEQIICYADKFFSKTSLDHEKTYDEACHSLRKFGEEGLRVFAEWHRRFA